MVYSGCTWIVGRALRCASSISYATFGLSQLSIRVHPKLDERTLDNLHSLTSLGDFGVRTSIFRPERAGVEKIRLADLSKIHVGFELDPQVGKCSCERSRLTPILRDKK